MDTRTCQVCKRTLNINQYPNRGRGRSRTCQSCLDVQKRVVPIPENCGIDPDELQRRLEQLTENNNNVIARNNDVQLENRTLINIINDRVVQLERRIIEDAERQMIRNQEAFEREIEETRRRQ